MKHSLESQLSGAVRQDTLDTLTEPLDIRVLEVRALCRIADNLERIAASLEGEHHER